MLDQGAAGAAARIGPPRRAVQAARRKTLIVTQQKTHRAAGDRLAGEIAQPFVDRRVAEHQTDLGPYFRRLDGARDFAGLADSSEPIPQRGLARLIHRICFRAGFWFAAFIGFRPARVRQDRKRPRPGRA